MKKQLRIPGDPDNFGSAAIHQPSQGEIRRMVSLVLLLLTVLLIGIATKAHADEKPANLPISRTTK